LVTAPSKGSGPGFNSLAEVDGGATRSPNDQRWVAADFDHLVTADLVVSLGGVQSFLKVLHASFEPLNLQLSREGGGLLPLLVAVAPALLVCGRHRSVLLGCVGTAGHVDAVHPGPAGIT